MRRQPPYQGSPSKPGEVAPTSVRSSRSPSDDRAVLLDRAADGAELEIRPIATSRGARWTRVETLLGFGLVVVLFGGALVNALANAIAEPEPTPTLTDGTIIGEATNGPDKTARPPSTPRPTVSPTPAITPAVACAPLTEDSALPAVNLVAPGLDPIPGTLGAFTWFGAVSPPSTLQLEESGAIPFEGYIEIQLDEICATRWTIVSSPAYGESSLQEVSFTNNGQSDWGSFTSNRADNPIISQQNRITVKTVGLGRVYVRALLNFEGGHQAQVYWLIRIKAFEAPAIHVIGPDGTDVTPVVGCGASVSISETGSWFGEECPPGSWPLLEDGPILTVHDGDLLRLEVPDWPLVYWGIRWVNQAEVQPGVNDPSDIGSMGGYDSLALTVIRWFVPPPGDYGVQFSLTHDVENGQYSLPVHVRLRVLP